MKKLRAQNRRDRRRNHRGGLSLYLFVLPALFALGACLQVPAFGSDECPIGSHELLQIQGDDSVDLSTVDAQNEIRTFKSFFDDAVAPSVPCEIRKQLSINNALTKITITRKSIGGHSTFAWARPTPVGPEILIHSMRFSSEDVQRALAHEFFHALHYWMRGEGSKLLEDRWVAEGLALYFESKAMGYLFHRKLVPPNDLVSAATRRPETSLTAGSFGDEALSRENYGHFYEYFDFLRKRCGGDDLMWSIAMGPAKPNGKLQGGAAIQEALKETARAYPECKSFGESVNTFEIARVHNHAQEDFAPGAPEHSRYVIDPELESNFINYVSVDHYLDMQARRTGQPDPAARTEAPGLTAECAKSDASATTADCAWDAIVASLPPWQPLVLVGSIELSKTALSHVRRIWSERVSPYRVSESVPVTDRGNWRQILIVEPPVMTK